MCIQGTYHDVYYLLLLNQVHLTRKDKCKYPSSWLKSPCYSNPLKWTNIHVSFVITAPQHLVCRAMQSLHISHTQMGIIEVFICRRLHMNTSMILIYIWLICRLCTALHTKCCGAVHADVLEKHLIMFILVP